MKKLLYVLLVALLGISIIGCDDAGSKTADDIKTTLEEAGYVLTQRDSDAIEYYQDTYVNASYEIEISVEDLYVGYINSTERWIELVVLSSDSDAETYQVALNDEGTEGRLVYRDGSVLLITYSSETIALFSGGKE
ncbi:MAG: hypothetical protein AB7U79_08150 [Candidatus Izemoplasmatales bacterium]